MLKEKQGICEQTIRRRSYAEYGIDDQRLSELQDGCRTGKYPFKTLQAACEGVAFSRPWILLSVVENRSYDELRTAWELGKIEVMPVGRTNFYALRRQFYGNLNKVLQEKKQ